MAKCSQMSLKPSPLEFMPARAVPTVGLTALQIVVQDWNSWAFAQVYGDCERPGGTGYMCNSRGRFSVPILSSQLPQGLPLNWRCPWVRLTWWSTFKKTSSTLWPTTVWTWSSTIWASQEPRTRRCECCDRGMRANSRPTPRLASRRSILVSCNRSPPTLKRSQDSLTKAL